VLLVVLIIKQGLGASRLGAVIILKEELKVILRSFGLSEARGQNDWWLDFSSSEFAPVNGICSLKERIVLQGDQTRPLLRVFVEHTL
jgi:hypothetical protein